MFSYQHFLDLSYYWLQNWLIPIVAEGRGKGGIAVPAIKLRFDSLVCSFKNSTVLFGSLREECI